MQIYRSELSPAFVDIFLKEIGLKEDEFELVLSHFRREFLPRNFFYVKPGQINAFNSYLSKGSTRTYTINEKGEEHILYFSFEDWWIGDLESMITGKPSRLYCQAIEDCEILSISIAEFEKLKEQFPSLKHWHEERMRRYVFSVIHRLTEVKAFTPEERYLHLLKKHSQIFQRIPLHHIASYLGIEPASLSRLRRRISSKKNT
ncbi:Crp/Fnr family transcriptional regulator [Runella aurantiaca]|uniref:Crp/Fnr family transcriptional regulator n=1 Tax=Runella aurantiaca TaxID=2282308 RepID=A0A369IGG4_9BACT|nr:Crp/Fnr family transcriptional regulator [Runella aurantiaca]RDB07437.1 Crp/Fnr family transcriptional regulator [Runella aurantiaca]